MVSRRDSIDNLYYVEVEFVMRIRASPIVSKN
jgi:hypothetical protein